MKQKHKLKYLMGFEDEITASRWQWNEILNCSGIHRAFPIYQQKQEREK